ncbi:hypothetical protein AJ80_05281 [Polytolypa hystricis UAMH7299]|uniref:Uncharacterized protein n=1 Tax=Polytolypa hystricis (strain UAMH7299) TaxID=1447883 RepID=A0A2B7Y5T5_POLH7|nr:hypothetical protein AJ80_05281 [Polytolypa hystricis UAMH7299]
MTDPIGALWNWKEQVTSRSALSSLACIQFMNLPMISEVGRPPGINIEKGHDFTGKNLTIWPHMWQQHTNSCHHRCTQHSVTMVSSNTSSPTDERERDMGQDSYQDDTSLDKA